MNDENTFYEDMKALYITRPPTALERRIAEKLGFNPDIASPYETDANYVMLLFMRIEGLSITKVRGGYWLERNKQLLQVVTEEHELYTAICELWLGDHA